MIRICTICARGGSKGVPGKNLRLLGGRPLVSWSVAQAKDARLFDLVAISSDCRAILDAATEAGADLRVERPSHMATDTAGKVPAIRHCLLAAEATLGRRADILVDLGATSPFRDTQEIADAVKLVETSESSNVISGTRAGASPYFNIVELDDAGTARISKPLDRQVLRRQDAPECFEMNGSIYVWKRDIFMKNPSVFYEDTQLFLMSEEHSLDIDTEFDFKLAQFVFENTGGGDL